MGTLICPEFNPTLKPQAQVFKEGFKQSMSGLYTSVTDACFGFSSAVAAFAFWLSLASHGLHFSVSKSTLVMSASESCPAHSGRMHNFLADTNLFFVFFFGCSRSSWAQITFTPISLFSYHRLQPVRAVLMGVRGGEK